MPSFTYEALNAAGKPQKGAIDAKNSEDAVQKIKAQGYFPTSVSEQKIKSPGMKRTTKKGKGKGAAKETTDTRGRKDLTAMSAAGGKKKKKELSIAIGRVKKKQLTTLTRQLSTLQDAGLPLLRSLQVLEEQQKPGMLKNILVSVAEDVEGGSPLSDAMAKHPKAFDRLYTKMINAGEIGGVLDVILQRLAEFMEKADRLARRIKGAMIYPVTVITVAVVIVTGIMLFVIPKFRDIFMDFGVELPGLTVWLINTSYWMAGKQASQPVPGAVYIFAAPILFFLFIKLLKKTELGRSIVDHAKLLIPGVGTLIRKTATARFTRTLGTLITAGVPILEALTITRDTSGNYVFEQALGKVHDSIRDGESFADPLRETKIVDPIVVNMIDVGEETGDMDVMLMKIADNYDEEVDTAVTGLVAMIEPLLVVVLGGIVGTVVVAMFLPLVAMIEGVSGGGI
ncbi:MAG: type II secretion system F family protein [Phycisphaerales bacterium]|nr:type II secretion system F family protein [Phycisphaerales bacterium]